MTDATGESARYFFDTEFIEDGRTIDLISIGIVCEDGREFYMESSQVPWHRASDWVNENVRPHLRNEGQPESEIATQVVEFVRNGRRTPEFWAYYADYDWVVLCQLFGTMMDLPDGWPMFCMDIKQEAVRLGDPELPKQESTEHHALADARWNAKAYAFLTALSGSCAAGGRRNGPKYGLTEEAYLVERGCYGSNTEEGA